MNYQIVADESVDHRIVIRLRDLGLTVHSIAEEQPSVSDNHVLSFAYNNKALLLTEDKDFGELVFRLQLPHYGILLIRIIDAEYKLSSVTEAIHRNYNDLLNKFSVLNKNKLRIKE